MNSTQRVRSITLSALLAGVLAGCSSGGTRHGTDPIGHALGPFTSPSPSYPQEASFLFTGDAEVDYVQWQEDATGSLQGTELDAKTTGHADELNVLHEANGPDTTGVCGDASGVSGDASGVSGDASGISSDLNGITTDLATLHDHASTVASDLTALLAIEPKYAGGAGPSPLDVHRALANASARSVGQ